MGERTHKQTHTHTLPLPHVDNMASHSNDGDECKASSHGGTARVGHDLIDHIAHVRAEERRIRDGVHRAHTAFVKGKLPVVQLDTSKWVCSWTRHQLKLWEMLNYGRGVAATFSTRKLRSQVLLGGKPLPATNEGLLGLPSATPSPFGDLTNRTNVVDTSVRNAVEFTDVSISPQLRYELAQRFAETSASQAVWWSATSCACIRKAPGSRRTRTRRFLTWLAPRCSTCRHTGAPAAI